MQMMARACRVHARALFNQRDADFSDMWIAKRWAVIS
jgi:hypothetical protein